ncbi:hypothetical protein QJQ45_027557, partial [Haematococcus lacustris]
AMVGKKRGVKATCDNAQKGREALAQRRAAEAEAKAQADARAYEAQLHQLQADLQLREQQVADTQRLQDLQQQMLDIQREEIQRKEQQVVEQQHQLQQQQADLHLREQLVAEQHQLQQQQQADMHLREQLVTEQQHQLISGGTRLISGGTRKVGVKVGCEGVQLQYRQFNKLDNGQGVELATVQTTLGNLVSGLNELMQKQLWHQYLAKHQRATFREHCAAVQNTPGLVVVSCDWSEKLTIHQDIACQGAYWKQRTMSVFVACAHYQDMAGNYREESVFVSADKCDQSAEASTTALVQVIECLLQGRRHPDGILGVASNLDGARGSRASNLDGAQGWVGKMDMRQLCLWKGLLPATMPRARDEPGEFQEPSPVLASLAVNGTRAELRRVYHLPREQAAEELHISLAHLKRTCQQLGVVRWPYRKLDSLYQLRSYLEKQPRPNAALQRAHLRAIELELQRIYNDPNHEIGADLMALRRHCWKQAQRIKNRASCSSLASASASALQSPASPSSQQSSGSRQRPTSVTPGRRWAVPGARAELVSVDYSGSLHCPGVAQLEPLRTASFSAGTVRGQGVKVETDAGQREWGFANVKSEASDSGSGEAQEQARVMHEAVLPCRTSVKRSSVDHLPVQRRSRSGLRNHTSLKTEDNEVRRQLTRAFQGFDPRDDASEGQGAASAPLPSVTSLVAQHAGVESTQSTQSSKRDVDGGLFGSTPGRGSSFGASTAHFPDRSNRRPSQLAGVRSFGAEAGTLHSLPTSTCAARMAIRDALLPNHGHRSGLTGWEDEKRWHSSYPPSPVLPTFGSLPSSMGHFSAAGPSTPTQQRPSLLAAPLGHASMSGSYPAAGMQGPHSHCVEEARVPSPAAGSSRLEPHMGDTLGVVDSGLPNTHSFTRAGPTGARLPAANPFGALPPLALQPLPCPPPAWLLAADSSHLEPTPRPDIGNGGVGSEWAGYHDHDFMLQVPDDFMQDADCMDMDLCGGMGALEADADSCLVDVAGCVTGMGMGLYSKSHPYRRKGGHAARCACCTKSTLAGSTGWVEIHVEGEAASYRSGCNHTAIGQVTAMMSEVIRACSNLEPQQVPLAHRACAEAAAAAHAVCQRLRGQEPASQLQPMPRLSSTPTQAPAQPGPAHAPCPHHLPDQPPSHPSQVQQAMQQCPTTKQRVACLLLDRVQLLMDSGTCGKKGGQHTDDVTARRVLARLVPPELLEQQLVSAFAQQTGLDRHWVSEAARQNLEQRASIQDRADSLRHFAAVRAPDNRGHQGISQAVFDYIRHYYQELQLQPDAVGSVMLTVRQYGKPSSAVGSRLVELLCMRVSLSDAVGMLNKQMPEYIKHHRLAHHQLQVFREHREAVKAGKDGKVVISCDWSEKLTVERSVEIMSEHWHAAQIGILVACAYFKNKEGAYYEQTVYVMTDGKEQSAAITQAAVNQVVCYLLAEHDMDMRQLYMWSDGCAGQFKGAPAMRQHWGMAQRFSVPVWWSYGATAHFKGRHDSEGGVVKQWLRGEILADRVGKCNALGFVQHCNAYHKAATAADPSKAHRARASVGHRWCLELSTQEVGLCSAPQRDAHAFASSIPGSMSMHSCFFPAAGIQVEWSQTACACAQCMTPAPRGVCMRPSITKPFVAMPMFDQKRDDKHWDDECLTLLCSFAPDSVKQLCTLGKKLSVKMLNEYCKAVGLYVPANTLRADLRRSAMATSPSASGNQATILDDDNWPIWSIRTEGLLVEAGLWSVVDDGVTPLPTAPAPNATQEERAAYAVELARSRADSALDRKAKAFIQRHVSNLHIFTVKSADSAQDAWETLESQFTESSVARQSQLQQQLSLLRMDPGESVARFYARLQQLLTELEACNCETSESTVVLAILAALPPEYESTVERLRYDQTNADLKVERIKRVLLTKEADLLSKQMQQQLSTSSSSLWSYSSPSESRGAGSSGGQGGRGRPPQQTREQQNAAQQQQPRAQSPDRSTRDVSSHAHLTCNYCAKPGHIMSECFTFDRDQRNRMKTLFSNPVRPSSPGRRPSPGRSSSPARTSSPSRGRARTPGRAATQSPSRGASLFTCSTAAAADDDDDDDDLDDVLMQMVQPRLNFNSDLYSPFCIDSGASQHILKDLQFFYNYTAFAPDKHRPVRLAAAGHRVWAVGSGSVFLSTKRGSWFLSHALYVPDSKQNFISVAAATKEGCSFLFREDLCQISSNQFGSMFRVNAHKIRNSYILAAVPMPDGPDTDSEQQQGAKLYNVRQSELQPDPRVKLELLTNVAAPSANSATSNSPQVWHQRLCHTSYDALARMQSAGMVSGVPVTAAQFRAAASDPAVCVGCVKGKQHKNVAFAGPPPNAAPVTAPLGLIHMDVCGPMHARARDGSLYVATFLDEHTKLSVCVPISSKAQVPDTVRTVIEELETQSGYRCKAIRTDNGTEYVNSRMREYCASKGIVHQHSAPYSPQQNGAAERLNRTIFEKARSIIHSADISLSFWAHAVKFANHVRCLLPVSGQPLTPWEAFYGVKPDLSGLRVFGCRVWLHVPDHQRSKLQSKSVEGLFLGYEPGSKAYKVLVNGRETCSKDIVFDELSVLISSSKIGSTSSAPLCAMPAASDSRPASTEAPAAPVPRRNPSRERHLPERFRDSDLFAMNVSDSPVNDTPTVAEALAGPMADLWIEAMNAELASLHANQTWCLEERPANARVLPTKWVLKVKRDAAGNIEKLKARLVAKGFYQQSGVDVGDVYAPVSKHTTLRTLLAKAAAENMEIHQLDFETAFLNGKLEPGEVIYVQQPEGFEEGSTNTVCRLQKALYGLRQAPRAWHARLCEELLSMGFKASEADPALFTLQLSTGMVYLLVYVDDCLLCTQQGDTAGLTYVKKQLSSAFKLKDLGEARWFLGMQLTRDRAEGTIKLDQHKFIQELVTANSKSAAHSKPLPMAPAVKLVREGDALDTTLHHYSALVGSLLYLTCCTRPDIAFAVGALARHMSAPTSQHWAAACSVLCYLKGTADQGLLFGGVSGLQGFSDADYAGDKDTARSTTGYIFTLNGGAISWSSRLQPTVAMSTAEAEHMAASSAAKEALWLRKLMRDLQLHASCVHLGSVVADQCNYPELVSASARALPTQLSRPAMATNPLVSGSQATILDDDNWPIWSIRTEGLLIEAGLWSVVADGVTPLPTAAKLARSRADSALDSKAKAIIQRHVSNLHIFTVKSADSAEDAWQTLESQFTQSSVARQSQLQQQLSLLRMEPGESVARFYARLQQLLTQLAAVKPLTLPLEYEGTVDYDQTSVALTVEGIKRVLLQKEADLLSKQMQQQLSTSSSTL